MAKKHKLTKEEKAKMPAEYGFAGKVARTLRARRIENKKTYSRNKHKEQEY